MLHNHQKYLIYVLLSIDSTLYIFNVMKDIIDIINYNNFYWSNNTDTHTIDIDIKNILDISFISYIKYIYSYRL